MDPRLRLRVALAGGGVLVAVVLFVACGGCGKRPPGGGDTTAAGSGSAAPAAALLETDAATLRDGRMWASAKDGDPEDLGTLAAHEGAAGLVEAASEVTLRPTAIRAMAYARGWAQLPFLAKAASGKDDAEAALALDAAVELGARPRRSEDPEDADELKEGCDGLGTLARDATRPRPRRVLALRALRMLPCPKPATNLPTDLDAK